MTQANKTTLQITCSNPNLIIENNFQGSLDEIGVLNKQLIFNPVENNVKHVACYGHQTFFIDGQNDLYVTGSNNHGLNGLGHTDDTKSFTKTASNVKKVCVACYNSMYLDLDGNVYICGQFIKSNGSYGTVSTWTKKASNVKDIDCSDNVFWIIDENNDLFIWGSNLYKQAGIDLSATFTNTFTKVASNVKQVCASPTFSCYVDYNNDLYFTGRSYALGAGSSYLQPTWMKIASNVQYADTGVNYICYIDNNNDLYVRGEYLSGALGIDVTANVKTFTKAASNVRTVSCKDEVTCYIDFDNNLYITGTGYAQASGNKTVKQFTKRASNVNYACTTSYNTWYVSMDNKLFGTGMGTDYAFGNNSGAHYLSSFKQFPQYIDFWSYEDQYFDLTALNVIVQGTPQIGDILNLKFTTVPPTSTTLTVKASNPALTINNNYQGVLQNPGVVNETYTYGIGYSTIKAKVTTTNICYVDSFGDLYLRGNFENAAGGDGTLESVIHNDTKIASNVKQVGGSYKNTYYITNDGDLYVAGKNEYGQLATGNTQDVLTFTKVADNVKDAYVYDHLLYIKDNGDLYVCGRNRVGQLGIGNTTNLLTPTKVASNVDFITADSSVSWYISKGELYGCGYNQHGYQGSGDTQDVLTFTKRAENVKLVCTTAYTTQYITNDNKLYGCGLKRDNLLFNNETESGSYNTFIHCADDVKHMYANNSIQYYVKTNGDLYVVGDNSNGYYGDGNSTPNNVVSGSTPVKVAENVDKVGFCHYYDMQGHLFLCGDNTHGQIMQQIQTFNLRAASVPTTHIPWTDITPTEEGWVDENDNLIDLSTKGVEIQGEPQPGDTVQLTFSTRRLQPVGLTLEHGDRVGFRFVTRQDYNTLLEQDAVTGNLIYAITDENILMLANSTYSINNRFVEEYPENPAQGVIYLNTKTRGVKMFNGADWTSIVPDVEDTLTAETLDDNLLTAKAIRNFVDPLLNDGLVKDVTYSVEDQIFNVEHVNGEIKPLALRNIVSSVTLENNVITFNKLGTQDIITLPEENFLIDSTFDGRVLTMFLKTGVIINVDLFDLLTIFVGEETSSAIVTIKEQEISIDVKLSQQNDNAITDVNGLFVADHLIKSVNSDNLLHLNNGELAAHLKISQDEGNKLVQKEDGLFVQQTDLNSYYNKEQLDVELSKEKDQEEFNEQIQLKIDPELVYTKDQVYNTEEVKPNTIWIQL